MRQAKDWSDLRPGTVVLSLQALWMIVSEVPWVDSLDFDGLDPTVNFDDQPTWEFKSIDARSYHVICLNPGNASLQDIDRCGKSVTVTLNWDNLDDLLIQDPAVGLDLG